MYFTLSWCAPWQAREAAEAAAGATAGQLAAADREAALLEDQLEQVTHSLGHASRQKQGLEAKLRQYEQARSMPPGFVFNNLSFRSPESSMADVLGSSRCEPSAAFTKRHTMGEEMTTAVSGWGHAQ